MARSVSRSSHAAYVLHGYDWSESSLILELFTRDHGRVAAVAKGAKRPYSQLRPVLMPFQRLLVTFGARRSDDAEVWLVRQAEWAGGEAWPGGAALLPGFYLNELLMRLLARHDPHPALFDLYACVLRAMGDPSLLNPALRAFELALLRQLGHLPDLAHTTVDRQSVQADQAHRLHPEMGVVRLPELVAGEPGATGLPALPGGSLCAIEQALEGEGEGAFAALMAACLPVQGELKAILRTLIHYHLGSQSLRTRQLMVELQQQT